MADKPQTDFKAVAPEVIAEATQAFGFPEGYAIDTIPRLEEFIRKRNSFIDEKETLAGALSAFTAHSRSLTKQVEFRRSYLEHLFLPQAEKLVEKHFKDGLEKGKTWALAYGSAVYGDASAKIEVADSEAAKLWCMANEPALISYTMQVSNEASWKHANRERPTLLAAFFSILSTASKANDLDGITLNVTLNTEGLIKRCTIAKNGSVVMAETSEELPFMKSIPAHKTITFKRYKSKAGEEAGAEQSD